MNRRKRAECWAKVRNQGKRESIIAWKVGIGGETERINQKLESGECRIKRNPPKRPNLYQIALLNMGVEVNWIGIK